jgi:membrane protein
MFKIIRDTARGFTTFNIPKLSGSLAYSTVFAMGPLLVVIIAVFGMLVEKSTVQTGVLEVLNAFTGPATAAYVESVISGFAGTEKSKLGAIVGLVLLFIGATGIFAEIQDSINIIWGLKAKPSKGFIKWLRNRFLSFSIIISLGFLLLVSLVLSGLIEAFNTSLQQRFPQLAIVSIYTLNIIVTLLVSSVIFAVIFKVLPDANIQWRHVWKGAFTTAILFLAGKMGITFYVNRSGITGIYGAAGSVIVLLVWIYYSAMILYIGAMFTKVYVIAGGAVILPNDYATVVEHIHVESKGEIPAVNDRTIA